MLRVNAHFGIMALHNGKQKREPKAPEPEVTAWQWTPEEKAHYDTFKPPDRTNRYRTTAFQRPVPLPKRIIDIWEEER